VSAVIAGLVLALGWWMRPRSARARRARRLRSGWEVGASAAWAAGPVRRLTAAPEADPAPLLRFRTAIERGASVVQAFESVAAGTGRWATGARRLVRRVDAGAGVQAAVDAWVTEDRDPSLRLLADALAISGSTGGSHLRAVDAVIDAVRERAALQREARALASQAQTSAVVLVLLPVAFAAAIAGLDPRVRGFYVGSALGAACIVGGLVLDALGAVLMVRLVRGVA